MPSRNLKDSKTEVSLEVDPALFLAFLEATDPELALEALPKILGGQNIHLIRRNAINSMKKLKFGKSQRHPTEHNDHDHEGEEEDDKKNIFRLY